MTLETEIPKMPTKEQTLSKPNNDEKFKILDALDAEIEALKKKQKKFFQDLKRINKEKLDSLNTSELK